MAAMPNATISVHRTKKVPFTVTNCTTALGDPLPATATLPLSGSNGAIANPVVDPANNRRFKIEGKSPGTAQVTVGSGPNALLIDVTVLGPPADQVSRVELDAFEPEE